MTSTFPRRSVLAAAALSVVLLPALTACGGTSAPPDSGGDVDGSTITITTIAQLKDQFQAWADAYTEQYPDRTVKIDATTTDVTQYTQGLATARLAGDMPDVFFNVDFLANTFAEDDVALDISSELADGKYGLSADEFLPQFLGQYRPLNDPEAITGLPVSADSTALAWNKSLFDEVGVTEYPSADWTFEDFSRVAAEIQEKSGGKVFGAVNPLADGSNITGYGPVLAAFGDPLYDPEAETVDLSSDSAVEAFTLLTDLYGTATAPYTTTMDDPALALQSGTVAMQIVSRGSIATIRDALTDSEWDVQETPLLNGKRISGGGSYGLSIGTASKNKEAALAFLGWFYDVDGGLAVAQTAEGGGIIPPTKSGLESTAWQDVEVPANIAVFAKTATDAYLQVQLPGSVSSTLNEALIAAIGDVELNGADLADALKTAEDKVNAALAEEAAK